MNAWVLMSSEADEADLPGFARFERRLDAALLEDPVGVVVIDALVKLPEVQMVGL